MSLILLYIHVNYSTCLANPVKKKNSEFGGKKNSEFGGKYKKYKKLGVCREVYQKST